jgi:putative endonuclease
MTTKERGVQGERAAESYLRRKGYRVLERNLRTRLGEIDLVCRDRNTIVFVEVKARMPNEYARPDQSVGTRKQAKLRRLVEQYLVTHRMEESDVRLDVVSVVLDPAGPAIEHIEGAL